MQVIERFQDAGVSLSIDHTIQYYIDHIAGCILLSG